MKKYLLVFLIILIFSGSNFSQDITFIPLETELTDTLGDEMVFEINMTNISSAEQTIFLVRTINDLPSDWTSSICLESCLPYWIDSATTTSEFGSTPMQPNESRIVSLHVLSTINPGIGHVQLQVGTLRKPTERITVDFNATAIITSIDINNSSVNNYYLDQNYPNPFNPSTKINFGLKTAGNVEITLYNILGSKVVTIFNGYKDAGNHSILFDGANLSSGVYFYKISSNDFTQTKKMILEK